jgi:hypothetical protein
MGPLFSAIVVAVLLACGLAVAFAIACFFMRPAVASWAALSVTAGFASGVIVAALAGFLVLGGDMTFESRSEVIAYLCGLGLGGVIGAASGLGVHARLRNGTRNAL